MTQLKTGTRLKSTVCDGEIMVVKAAGGDVEITCGGAPMADPSQSTGSGGGEVAADHDVGITVGKRYITQDESMEILCVKGGKGGLAIDGQLLLQKDTKKLPKTD